MAGVLGSRDTSRRLKAEVAACLGNGWPVQFVLAFLVAVVRSVCRADVVAALRLPEVLAEYTEWSLRRTAERDGGDPAAVERAVREERRVCARYQSWRHWAPSGAQIK